MSGLDTRGFDYALQPARQRAHHRVDAAIGLLGQSQLALEHARQRVIALQEQCSDLARRCTPLQRAVIDPRHALAVSHRLSQLRAVLAEAQQEAQARAGDVDTARRQLERARVEQQTYDSHHDEALQAHVLDSARRQQVATDQDWLARQHVVRALAVEGGTPS